MEITNTLVEDVPGFIQVYADGFVSRYDHGRTAASEEEAASGAKSRDVVIDAAKGVWARMFLPAALEETERLPLLFYFHGGGFCIGSTAWAGFHNFLSGLAATARLMVISVDYRLAPEHRLPVAYDDCFDALYWCRDSSNGDAWLSAHADYSSCFLAGESAGANIAHVVGSRSARSSDLAPLLIRGLVIIHPYFGSQQRLPCEMAAAGEDALALEYNDLFWRLALPLGSDRDNPLCNPDAPGAPDLRDLALPPVLVTIASLDLLHPRGLMYYELLKSCGKDVHLMVADGQIHAYHIFNPDSEAARLLQTRISEFIRRLVCA